MFRTTSFSLAVFLITCGFSISDIVNTGPQREWFFERTPQLTKALNEWHAAKLIADGQGGAV